MHTYGPLDCDWVPAGDGLWTCPLCRAPASRRVKFTAKPPPRNCPRKAQLKEPCRHRGECIGFVPCDTCSGTVKIKVFACPTQERCTTGKRVGEIACCPCADYEPPVSACALKKFSDRADEAGSAAG